LFHELWTNSKIFSRHRVTIHDAVAQKIPLDIQACDFLGNNPNAVHWQIWIALLVYVLLRFLAFLSQWSHSFTRLGAMTRSALWRKIDFCHWLKSCGTAGGNFHFLSRPE
jgi:hypothetical protein